MINEQELHRRFLGRDRCRRTREDLHSFHNRCRAGRHRFGLLFDLYQAHAAVRCDRQFFVVTKPRHIGADAVGHLHDHLTLPCLDRLTVNLDIDHIVSHAAASG